MPVVVRNQPETRVVPIPGLDGCTVTVREPTTEEIFSQWTESAGQRLADGTWPTDQGKLFTYRLRVVVDWCGFVDQAGNTLPFSQASLSAAIRQNEPLLWAVASAARDAFGGIGADDEKNSVVPPADGSLVADVMTGG